MGLSALAFTITWLSVFIYPSSMQWEEGFQFAPEYGASEIQASQVSTNLECKLALWEYLELGTALPTAHRSPWDQKVKINVEVLHPQ